MPHPNDQPMFPRLEHMRGGEIVPVLDSPREAIDPSTIKGPRLFSVVIISAKGNEIHTDVTLEIADDEDQAKRAAIMGMRKDGRLLRQVNAMHITKARIETALRTVVA